MQALLKKLKNYTFCYINSVPYRLYTLYRLYTAIDIASVKLIAYFTAHFFYSKEKSVVNMLTFTVYLKNNTTLHFGREYDFKKYLERHSGKVVKVEQHEQRIQKRRVPEGMRTPVLVFYGVRRPVVAE